MSFRLARWMTEEVLCVHCLYSRHQLPCTLTKKIKKDTHQSAFLFIFFFCFWSSPGGTPCSSTQLATSSLHCCAQAGKPAELKMLCSVLLRITDETLTHCRHVAIALSPHRVQETATARVFFANCPWQSRDLVSPTSSAAPLTITWTTAVGSTMSAAVCAFSQTSFFLRLGIQ